MHQDAWKDHFSQEQWNAMEEDPDYPWEKLLSFYKTAGNPEEPVIQSVIIKIETFLKTKI